MLPGVVEWVNGLGDAREAYFSAHPVPNGWVILPPPDA
jgi:hypothetical protein